MNVKEILENIGYKLKEDGDFLRGVSLHRGGDNPTSLRINKHTGSYVDFPVNDSGSFDELLRKAVGETEARKIKTLSKVEFSLKEPIKDKLTMQKTFSLEDLGTTVRNYNFYNKRGISEETQKLFDLSVCMSGKMCRRVVFPIYEPSGEVLGFAGRSIFPNDIKWKKIGETKNWRYPLFLSEEYIKAEDSVILVESIGDTLALFDAGIKNVLCLFGIKLLKGVKQELIRLSPKKVYISTNNEPDNHSRGNNAAQKIYEDLTMYFSENKLEIKLPPQKDFGDCSKEEIINWYK